MRAIFLIVSFLALMSSSQAKIKMLADKPFPPTPKSKEIDVVFIKNVEKEYVLIADISGSDLADLKKQARTIGADAIAYPEHNGWGTQFTVAIKYK